MPRTTVDIAAPVLRDLKRLQKKEGKTLGEVVTELVVQALSIRERRDEPSDFRWTTKDMGARVDLEDKDAVWRALDGLDEK